MMRHLVCAAVAVACGWIAAPAAAQSLGDLARQEEARRTTAKKSVKSFSNADLAPSEIASPAPPAPVAAAAPCDPKVSEDKCASPDAQVVTPAAGDAQTEPEMPPQVEGNWRRNAEEIRAQLAKARADYNQFAATAQDDSRGKGEPGATDRMAAQHQRVIERLERRWERFEKQAQELNVPNAWIEPKPTLSTRMPQ